MTTCERCGCGLTNDEIAIHRRLVDRRAVRFSCITCLSRMLGCDTSRIEDKIRAYREQGCFLFPPHPTDGPRNADGR